MRRSPRKENKKMKNNQHDLIRETDAEMEGPESEQEPREDTGRALVVYSPPPVRLDEPDSLIVAQQVTESLNVPRGIERDLQDQLRDETIALYAAIGPRDAAESVLARLLVATSNAAMDCYRRSASNEAWPRVRDVDLRNGIKASQAPLT
jgi:hypothetical protein